MVRSGFAGNTFDQITNLWGLCSLVLCDARNVIYCCHYGFSQQGVVTGQHFAGRWVSYFLAYSQHLKPVPNFDALLRAHIEYQFPILTDIGNQPVNDWRMSC